MKLSSSSSHWTRTRTALIKHPLGDRTDEQNTLECGAHGGARYWTHLLERRINYTYCICTFSTMDCSSPYSINNPFIHPSIPLSLHVCVYVYLKSAPDLLAPFIRISMCVLCTWWLYSFFVKEFLKFYVVVHCSLNYWHPHQYYFGNLREWNVCYKNKQNVFGVLIFT